MGVKDNILKIIKKIDGISYNDIRTKLERDYKQTFTKKSGYVFIKRLKDEGLITSNFGFINGKKHYTYKSTLKAHIPLEKRKNIDKEIKDTNHICVVDSIRWIAHKTIVKFFQNEFLIVFYSIIHNIQKDFNLLIIGV